MGIMTAITTTTIVYYHQVQSDEEQLPLRPPVDRRAFLNKCLSGAGGDGAGLPSTSKGRASVKKRMAGIMAKTRQLAQLL
jgi:hypothetical protein